MENSNMSDLINNFKDIFNNQSSNTSTSQSTDSQNNLNITPEMINNIADMLKNSEPSSNTDQNQKKEATNSSSSSENSNIDFSTILKIKNIMESLNQSDDARSNLLYSLKPYLRESRQKKIDQYVNIFKFSGIAKLFRNEKGDSK